ncbi:MAG TPA: DUF47 family protein [bacterium]
MRFFPREEKFFEFFENAGEKIENGIVALIELLDNFTDIETKVRKIKDIEHESDNITHSTIEKLNKTFITPFDREDIHELITKMDDILDFVEAVSQRIWLYRIEKPNEEVKQLAYTLLKAVKELRLAIKELKNLKNSQIILAKCIEINRLENEGDQLLRKAIANLFLNTSDPITIIKLKEIYETIEFSIDRCEDVANIIEGIVLKNA